MSDPKRMSRRDLLSIAGAAGAVAGAGLAPSVFAQEVETAKTGPTPNENAERMPYGKIGDVKISRILLGGNLIGGWMHARDLKYVGSLFRHYATEDKILETLRVAEENGVNTVFETGANFIERYNREMGGNMQFIPHIKVEVNQNEDDLKKHIENQVNQGACAVYVWGVAADQLARAGAIDQLGRAVELAKTHGIPVGVGGHSLSVPVACEKDGVPADFYVKTLHRDDYPSATPPELRKDYMWLDNSSPGWYDNMWCISLEETIEFFQTVEKPWLAFKILAAGAYHPQQAIPWAFESGADFIAVGMFDFQIEQNCRLVPRSVAVNEDRKRPWRA